MPLTISVCNYDSALTPTFVGFLVSIPNIYNHWLSKRGHKNGGHTYKSNLINST